MTARKVLLPFLPIIGVGLAAVRDDPTSPWGTATNGRPDERTRWPRRGIGAATGAVR